MVALQSFHRISRPLWLCLLVACSPASIGADLEPLTREDIDQIPPGNARSHQFAGVYTIVSDEVDFCGCREGDGFFFDCDGFTPSSFELAHTAGSLTLTASDEWGEALVLTGGIDEDGHFSVGHVGPARTISATTTGQMLDHAEGVAVAGNRLELRWRTRAEYSRFDETFDCDVLLSFDARHAASPTSMLTCTFPTDCPSTHRFCVEGQCSSGQAGSPCTSNIDCDPLQTSCIANTCRALGQEGDPCTFGSDCASSLFCGLDDTCEAF